MGKALLVPKICGEHFFGKIRFWLTTQKKWATMFEREGVTVLVAGPLKKDIFLASLIEGRIFVDYIKLLGA